MDLQTIAFLVLAVTSILSIYYYQSLINIKNEKIKILENNLKFEKDTVEYLRNELKRLTNSYGFSKITINDKNDLIQSQRELIEKQQTHIELLKNPYNIKMRF